MIITLNKWSKLNVIIMKRICLFFAFMAIMNLSLSAQLSYSPNASGYNASVEAGTNPTLDIIGNDNVNHWNCPWGPGPSGPVTVSVPGNYSLLLKGITTVVTVNFFQGSVSVLVTGNTATISGINPFFVGGGGWNKLFAPGDVEVGSNQTTYNVSGEGTKVYTLVTGDNQGGIYEKSISVPFVTPTTYSVSYASGGATSGNVPTDGTVYTAGQTVTVKGNTGNLAKTGYTFAGWEYNSTTYTAGQTFAMPSSNVTLTAKWDAVTSIEAIQLGVSVWAQNGIIYVKEQGVIIEKIDIYNFSGQILRRIVSIENNISLPKGIYILHITIDKKEYIIKVRN
jgi:uncharacterized repeat protein (TIGR02543 family)